jgi:ribokinase
MRSPALFRREERRVKIMAHRIFRFTFLVFHVVTAKASAGPLKHVVVVGSANVDLTFEVSHLPSAGETVVADKPCSLAVAGGKGCNQAIAVAKMLAGTGRSSRFVGRLGDDEHGTFLRNVLVENKVYIEFSSVARGSKSGAGYVFVEPGGAVASVVVSGSNAEWPDSSLERDEIEKVLSGAAALLLQREIPERINEAYAAAAERLGIPVVIQDVGGADRPISNKLLSKLTFISPNLTELARLTGLPTSNADEVLAAAQSLKDRGVKNVLVTLGSEGSLLLTENGNILRQVACPPPGGVTVDETGAGDCFRAAFCVALVEGSPLRRCLQLAAAAGAISVSRMGAVPSLPLRFEVEELCAEMFGSPNDDFRGGATSSLDCTPSPPQMDATSNTEDISCPLEFGSRLNSMKDRLDLWDGPNDVLGWVSRQGNIQGLSLVDFNYPQHLGGLEPPQVKGALSQAGLRAGAICLRFPKSMQAGAFTNPDPAVRQEAIDLTLAAAKWALELGTDEVVVWSAFDGYDYSHQVNFVDKWNQIVEAFQHVCDAFPDVKFSLEFKPTDENTRFFIVPSTGAALLLVQDIDRDNMGLTLDVGHCLAAGENPAQSAALVGSRGKLFGVQLNDGYQRLGAEDGLMFASVHPGMALELMTWLQRTDFKGHLYFDTFPRNEDPVLEAEWNIRRAKALWTKARRLSNAGIASFMNRHDALGALELIEKL